MRPSAVPSSQRGRRSSRQMSESCTPCSCGTSRASRACITMATLNSTDARAASATPAATDDMGGNHDGSMSGATFLYDVGSPWCWLAGERVTHVLGAVPVWQPVLAAGLPGDGDAGSSAADRAAV